MRDDTCLKELYEGPLSINRLADKKSSEDYQHTVSIIKKPISGNLLDNFKKAMTAKVSGRFFSSEKMFRKLLYRSDMNREMRAECHFQLSGILNYLYSKNNEVLEHLLACRTMDEYHYHAVSEIERLYAPGIKSKNSISAPRILLVLGSNAATVAFANQFFRKWPIAGIIQQYIRYPVLSKKFAPTKGELPLGIDQTENGSFGNETILGNQWNALFMDYEVPRIFVGRGEMNKEYVLKWVKRLKPDLIVSHGPERLKNEFIRLAKHGGINVHWGLSPRYRGMDTARWALFHKKPEWVGVTIHKLDENLDTGPIIYQARPELKLNNTFRMIEYSLTMLACKIVPVAVKEVLSGNAKIVPQDTSKGTQYMACQWTKKHQETLTTAYLSRQIGSYLSNKKARDKRVELINPWRPH